MQPDHPPVVEPPGIVDRPQTDRGLLGRVVPLLALGLMFLMVLQSCLSTASLAPASAPVAPAPANK